MKFITAAVSKTGNRLVNQDYCAFLQINNVSCWVLADGLGGHGGGEVASQVAVDNILESFKALPEVSITAIKRYIEAGQDALIQRQEENPRLSSMRTTVVILLTDIKSVIWAHLGDSRLYYFRSGSLQVQTKDHSVPQALVDAGDITSRQIRFHEDRNRLLRVMGKKGELRPNIEQQLYSIQKGDAFLLCTDGFWESITETEMEIELTKSDCPSVWVRRMENRILDCAQRDLDNYSAIAIFVN